VPLSILLNEYLPKLRKDPGYLDKIGFKVIGEEGKVVSSRSVNWMGVGSSTRLGIQQPSGGDNALGEIKFLFPNKHSIYMHDTPSRQLFANRVRAFSHGCVRVENPRQFAQILLGWTPEEVDTRVESGDNTSEQLAIKIPVHLTYFTAWPGEDGNIQYYSDIYERDLTMKNAMKTVEATYAPKETQRVVDAPKAAAATIAD
jgi:murein L,D-transpeptidase YcbB/YkuD